MTFIVQSYFDTLALRVISDILWSSCFSRLATSRPLGERSEPCLAADRKRRNQTKDFFESLLFQ